MKTLWLGQMLHGGYLPITQSPLLHDSFLSFILNAPWQRDHLLYPAISFSINLSHIYHKYIIHKLSYMHQEDTIGKMNIVILLICESIKGVQNIDQGLQKQAKVCLELLITIHLTVSLVFFLAKGLIQTSECLAYCSFRESSSLSHRLCCKIFSFKFEYTLNINFLLHVFHSKYYKVGFENMVAFSIVQFFPSVSNGQLPYNLCRHFELLLISTFTTFRKLCLKKDENQNHNEILLGAH